MTAEVGSGFSLGRSQSDRSGAAFAEWAELHAFGASDAAKTRATRTADASEA